MIGLLNWESRRVSVSDLFFGVRRLEPYRGESPLRFTSCQSLRGAFQLMEHLGRRDTPKRQWWLVHVEPAVQIKLCPQSISIVVNSVQKKFTSFSSIHHNLLRIEPPGIIGIHAGLFVSLDLSTVYVAGTGNSNVLSPFLLGRSIQWGESSSV